MFKNSKMHGGLDDVKLHDEIWSSRRCCSWVFSRTNGESKVICELREVRPERLCELSQHVPGGAEFAIKAMHFLSEAEHCSVHSPQHVEDFCS
jgi:hypothetical protein